MLQAKARNVAIGAHPGYRDLVGFGRRPLQIPAEELVADIVYQLGALRELARLHGLRLQHLKPHGALFMHLAWAIHQRPDAAGIAVRPSSAG